MLIIGVCGTDEFILAVPVVWVGAEVLAAIITTHVGLGGVLSCGVPGMEGPGDPIVVVIF